jgi:hypothetical protein
MIRIGKLVAACAFAVACVSAHAGGVMQSGYSPLYLGVDTEEATVPSNPATPGGSPTVSHAYIMRVDLHAPGVALTTTEKEGPACRQCELFRTLL